MFSWAHGEHEFDWKMSLVVDPFSNHYLIAARIEISVEPLVQGVPLALVAPTENECLMVFFTLT